MAPGVSCRDLRLIPGPVLTAKRLLSFTFLFLLTAQKGGWKIRGPAAEEGKDGKAKLAQRGSYSHIRRRRDLSRLQSASSLTSSEKEGVLGKRRRRFWGEGGLPCFLLVDLIWLEDAQK